MNPLSSDLSRGFKRIASEQIVPIPSLGVGTPYLVLHARKLTTQYGPIVQLTLSTDTDANLQVKVFLPKRYAEAFDDQDIQEINCGEKKYKLIYEGKAGNAYIIHLELYR